MNLETENKLLREIICRCAEALGNGSACGPQASIEFMSMIPAEIAAEVKHLKERFNAIPNGGNRG